MAGVLLHGRERSAEEMISLAVRLDLPGVRWLAPQAEGGLWYPNRFTDPIAENEPMLTQSIECCEYAVAEASEGGRLEPSQIFVLGFSQGACLALEYALRRPQTCGALVVFTGALMGTEGATRPGLREAFAERPVMITGSDIDDWVPEENLLESADILSKSGARVVLRNYQSRPHEVADVEIADAHEFLDAIYESERAWLLKKRLRSLIA
jgi:predicted esterase